MPLTASRGSRQSAVGEAESRHIDSGVGSHVPTTNRRCLAFSWISMGGSVSLMFAIGRRHLPKGWATRVSDSWSFCYDCDSRYKEWGNCPKRHKRR